MQPRTLESVLASLNSVYSPQIDSIRQRQSLIPQQVESEERGLEARQTQAFDDILGGARRRGLGFAGIPLAEQARYTSTEFLPAIARLRQGAREQAMSLEDAILGINERRNAQGQSIYESERNFAEQQRQFNEAQRRAAASAANDNSWLSALLSNVAQPTQTPQRPSLDAIFGTKGAAAPTIRVATPSQSNRLQPSGGLNFQAPMNTQTGFSGVLQGGGALQGSLVKPKPKKTGLKVVNR